MKFEIIFSVVFVVVFLWGGILYSEYRCKSKATMMNAYAWDYSLFSTGCMIKEFESSDWRDVVTN